MIVKLRVHTGWNHQALKPGDRIEVASIVAKRWQENGIAAIMDEPDDAKDLSRMTVKELKALAKKNGLKVGSRLTKKQLVEALRNGV